MFIYSQCFKLEKEYNLFDHWCPTIKTISWNTTEKSEARELNTISWEWDKQLAKENNKKILW